jgi:hypothetical protein
MLTGIMFQVDRIADECRWHVAIIEVG